MLTLTEITDALLEKVTDTAHRVHIPTLAQLVHASLYQETLSPGVEWKLTQGEEQLLPLLKDLSGQQIQVADKVLEFHQGPDKVNTQRRIESTFKWFMVPVNAQGIGQIAIGERNVQISGNNYAPIDLGDRIISIPTKQIDQEAAKRHLRELPLDRLPPLQSSLPEGSFMYHARNPLFTGRTKELLQLASIFKGSESEEENSVIPVGIVVASTGAGGLGKTQLATEFVYRYGQYFDGGVFWLNFTNEESIPIQVAACGGPRALDLRPNFASFSDRERIAYVQQAWEKDIPRLLIFDDCDDEDLFHKWRPRHGGCRILITSRRGQWSRGYGVRTLPLHVFERAESVELLRKFLDNLPVDISVLEALANELENFPLALHLAGCYLDHYRHTITPAEYLDRLRHPPQSILEDISLQQGDKSPTEHEQHVARTFALSYERLDMTRSEDVASRAALARAAIFAAGEPIPRVLLRRTLRAGPYDYNTKIRIDESFTRLVTLGLLEIEEQGALRIHPLIADFTRNRVGTQVGDEAWEVVEQVVVETLRRPQDMEITEPLALLEAHLLTVIDRSSSRYMQMNDPDNAVTSQLLLDPYLVQWGKYTTLIAQYEKIHGAVTLPGLNMQILIHHGNAYTGIGQYQKAINYYLAAADIARQEDKREIHSMILGLLAIPYIKLGKTQEAINLYQKEAILSARNSRNSTLEAKWLINLGVCCYDLGQFEQGMKAYLQAQATIDNDEEPTISFAVQADILIGFGFYSNTQGRLEDALQHYKEALNIARKNGYRSIEATCLGNIGDAYTALAQYEQAHPYFDQALNICHMFDLKGLEGNVLHSLAELLIDEQRYDEATKCANEGIDIGQKVADPQIISSCYIALARAYLLSHDFLSAYSSALTAKEYNNVILNEHYALALFGIAQMRKGEIVAAINTFEGALRRVSLLLDNNPHYCEALDTQAIASYGLALCRQSNDTFDIIAKNRKKRSADQDRGIQRRIQELIDILENTGVHTSIQGKVNHKDLEL